MHFLKVVLTAFLQLLLLLLQQCNSYSMNIITYSQSIRDGDLLLSNNETFVLGFFSPGTTRKRYVGIWFKFSEEMVVWVANRNNPVHDTSGVLTMSSDGNLLLHNHSRSLPLWSTNLSPVSSNAVAAHLLETGNLVLVDDNQNMVWQSFDHLTHVTISHMKIGMDHGKSLYTTSWISKDDPGTGSWKLGMELNGTPQVILYENDAKRWRAGHWDGIYLSGLPHLKQTSDDIVFKNNIDEVTTEWVARGPYTLGKLDESGTIRLLAWQGEQRRWIQVWSAPTDVCDKYGNCGMFGVCNAYIANWVKCSCYPGYEPNSPQEWEFRDGSGGCKRKKEAPSMCRNREGFVKLENMKIPDASTVDLDKNMSVEACKHKCLSDCSCLAFAMEDVRNGGSGCMIWHQNLIDTTQFTKGQGQDLYIRADELVSGTINLLIFQNLIDTTQFTKGQGQDLYIRADELVSAKYAESKGFIARKRKLLILLMPVDMTLLVLFGCWCLRRKRKSNLRKMKLDDNASLLTWHGSNQMEHSDLTLFDLQSIAVATDNFSTANKLGQGGFGSVYKGKLANGQEVAVKRLSTNSGQGLEQFKNEVTLIAKLQHRNLVRLLGCCIHREEKILIYEYLPNKSLDFFIYDQSRSSSLKWKERFEIIIGIARGVLYLHQDSRLKIIHRDLKASNILLDSTMNPNISDFGLAKMFGEDQIQARTVRVVGTYGYMSPEYAMEGRYSIKSDVFSFGVLLLEIVSGRRATRADSKSRSQHLIEWIWDMWKEEQALGIVDPSLGPSYPTQEVLRCIHIGLLCVQEYATNRPTMLDVVFMMGTDTALPYPMKPAYILQSSDPNSAAPPRGDSINNVTITMVQAR